jgi:SH3-like domain-containing protein
MSRFKQSESWSSRCAVVALVAAVMGSSPGPAIAGNELGTGMSSGLPIPRFVSIKPDRVNVRGGPTKDHDVAWTFTRAGLPVEITAEADNWRRIRDWEGSEGWVYHSLLSGRRTAMVNTKTKDELVPLHAKADAKSALVAQLQGNVVSTVKRCSGGWCEISGQGFEGWIVQERLWGVYPNETIE